MFERILTGAGVGALTFGIIGFLEGFLGPMILMPQANQRPLPGIFITGAPLSAIADALVSSLRAPSGA